MKIGVSVLRGNRFLRKKEGKLKLTDRYCRIVFNVLYSHVISVYDVYLIDYIKYEKYR